MFSCFGARAAATTAAAVCFNTRASGKHFSCYLDGKALKPLAGIPNPLLLFFCCLVFY